MNMNKNTEFIHFIFVSFAGFSYGIKIRSRWQYDYPVGEQKMGGIEQCITRR